MKIILSILRILIGVFAVLFAYGVIIFILNIIFELPYYLIATFVFPTYGLLVLPVLPIILPIIRSGILEFADDIYLNLTIMSLVITVIYLIILSVIYKILVKRSKKLNNQL